MTDKYTCQKIARLNLKERHVVWMQVLILPY